MLFWNKDAKKNTNEKVDVILGCKKKLTNKYKIIEMQFQQFQVWLSQNESI